MKRRPGPPERHRPPLSSAAYHILIALGDGEKHGYALMREISERTGGAVEMLPGTLYSTIKRMLGEGWIEERPAPAGAGRDQRRRYYRMTDAGREMARAETERLARLVRLARKKGLAATS